MASFAFISYADVLMETEQLAVVIFQAQKGNPAAFDELVDRYSTRLYGYFYRLTGSQHDAEDLLQELFVRLVRMINKYQHQGRFDSWLFRIATNLVRDRVRRVKSAKAMGLMTQNRADSDKDGHFAHQPDSSAETPAEALSRAEQIDLMQQAIERLPDSEREVILMRHFSEMSFREIAETMEIPLGTALARAHRGLGRLREMMEDKEE